MYGIFADHIFHLQVSMNIKMFPQMWERQSTIISIDKQKLHFVSSFFDDAVRPTSKANPQSIALGLKGAVTYACKVKYEPAATARQLTIV